MPHALGKKNDASPASTNDVSFVHPLNPAIVVPGKIRSFVFYSKTHFNQFLAQNT
jgi:hypothetical protein